MLQENKNNFEYQLKYLNKKGWSPKKIRNKLGQTIPKSSLPSLKIIYKKYFKS